MAGSVIALATIIARAQIGCCAETVFFCNSSLIFLH